MQSNTDGILIPSKFEIGQRMFAEPIRCAITGSSGFLGRGVTEFMSARGVHVIALDRTTIQDFADVKSLSRPFSGCHVVIHTLGRAHILKHKDPATELTEFRRVNVELALAAAKAAVDAGVPKFLFVSSVSVFGIHQLDVPVNDLTRVRPVTPYGHSKAEAEDALEDFGAHNGLAVVTLRPPLIYGPQAPGNFARLVSALKNGIPMPFGSVAGNRRTFLARDNLSDAILRVAQDERILSGRFIVADNESLSTRTTIEAIAKGLGKPARLLPFPPKILSLMLSALHVRAMTAQLLGSLEFDGTSFCRALNWQPIVGPFEGLREMGAAAATLR